MLWASWAEVALSFGKKKKTKNAAKWMKYSLSITWSRDLKYTNSVEIYMWKRASPDYCDAAEESI